MLEEFFEAKKRLYPQNVKGKIRNIKSILNTIFLSIYFFSPFFRYNRGENIPDQAILIDLANSKAYFFFIEIWPQEVYYFMGILIFSALTLFFITSLFGRIWCGFGCFQTVWTDIFIALERFFQGDRNKRIILDRKNNFEKFYKKFLTHFSWIIVSLLTGYAFICYFNDSITLTKELFNGYMSNTSMGWIAGVAGMTYVMAGFAREHVCTYMCPYSRFQSAMFDKNTLIITYDEERGEPRGKLTKDIKEKNSGHCIDCKQCVVVCPTGIDIRDGLQMECIACGLCVDACDNIMDKVGLPKGLIRYDTEANLENPKPNNKFKILKPRTFYYLAILLVTFSLILGGLITKTKLEASINPDRNPLFVTLSNGDVRNGYQVRIINKSHEKRTYSLKITSPKEALLVSKSSMIKNLSKIEVKANSSKTFKIYTILPKKIVRINNEGKFLIDFILTSKDEERKIQAVSICR